MTSKKRTGNAVMRSVVGLLLCFGILAGSAFSLVAEASAFDIIIEAGDFDIKMDWLEGSEDPNAADAAWVDATQEAMFKKGDLWEPGFTAVRHVKITNGGKAPVSYSLALNPKEGENTSVVIGELADAIDVYYLPSARAITGRSDAIFSEEYKLGTLAEVLTNVEKTDVGTLEAGSHSVTIALKMRESAGNYYQNKSIGSGFNVVLVATAAT